MNFERPKLWMLFSLGLISMGSFAAFTDRAAFANQEAPKKTRYSVLNSTLLSAEEFREQNATAGIPNRGNIQPGKNVICKDLGLSCLGVEVLNDPSTLAVQGRPTTDEFGIQVLQQSFELYNELSFEQSSDKARTDVSYLAWFDANGFLKIPQMVKSSDLTVQNGLGNLTASSDTAIAEQDLLQRPKSFRLFPEMLEQARASHDLTKSKVLEKSVKDGLLLALEAVVPIADFRQDTYPFQDQLVSKNSMLQITGLYQKLKAIGRWPEIVDLTPEDRASFKGAYQEKTADGKRWLVKGFYDEQNNVIHIDLTNDFFENLFVYYHELWHVAWAHSSFDKEQISKILSLLSKAEQESNKSDLRLAVLSYLSLNEFFAIDQQIRLFHAIGDEAENWDSSETPSARAWHDSYMGADIYSLLIPRALRKSKDPANPWLSFAGLDFLASSVNGHVVDTQQNHAEGQLKVASTHLDDAYWKARMKAHASLFEQKYFGASLNLEESLVPVSAEDLTGKQAVLTLPFVPALSCEDIRRIREALGDNWTFGFPFRYELKAGETCSGGDGSSNHPGNHPGAEGSHTDLDAFPDLEGPSQTH